MPNQLSETEKAYLAGFIDGEGCIFIKRRNENSTWLQLMVTISQKDVALLDELKDMIGEKSYLRRPTKARSAGNLCYASGQAYRILKAIYPYLRLKKMQAEVSIEFYEKYSFLSKGRQPKNQKMWQSNPDLLEQREGCFWAVKRLKELSYA